MKKFLKIFLICLQDILAERSRSVVWFLSSLGLPLVMILYWTGVYANRNSINGWVSAEVTSYYLLFVLCGSMLTAHQEEDVATRDIQKGELVQYLMKPFSYYWYRFLQETPYRLFQGGFGIIGFIILVLFFSRFIFITDSPIAILLSLVIAVLGYMISYTYKLVLGLLAFWFTDMGGIFNLSEFLLVLFGGFIIPIAFMPPFVQKIAYILPFAYSTYFPVIGLIGKLSLQGMSLVIGMQLLWLLILSLVYHLVIRNGLRKFSAVGN